mmetsp:Transcript_27543/g.36815  ORF Transcript_27543/g.36815 Transcript_27543/m.36815 type:complete len:110 (+) Transcript_27543:297-626(+)
MVPDIPKSVAPSNFSTDITQGSWACTSTKVELLNQIVCRNVMPVEQGLFPAATFRWMPEWGVVEQWGYQSINDQAQWIKLGRVALMGAIINHIATVLTPALIVFLLALL